MASTKTQFEKKSIKCKDSKGAAHFKIFETLGDLILFKMLQTRLQVKRPKLKWYKFKILENKWAK